MLRTFEITRETRISLQPKSVDYRVYTGLGDQRVRIDLSGSEPKVSAWTERLAAPANNGIEIGPLALTLSDIEAVVRDARVRLGI